MLHHAALTKINAHRILRSVTFRIDEQTHHTIRAIREGLTSRGLHPTSEADLVRLAIQKLGEAVETVPPATRFASVDQFRVIVPPLPDGCSCTQQGPTE